MKPYVFFVKVIVDKLQRVNNRDATCMFQLGLMIHNTMSQIVQLLPDHRSPSSSKHRGIFPPKACNEKI